MLLVQENLALTEEQVIIFNPDFSIHGDDDCDDDDGDDSDHFPSCFCNTSVTLLTSCEIFLTHATSILPCMLHL